VFIVDDNLDEVMAGLAADDDTLASGLALAAERAVEEGAEEAKTSHRFQTRTGKLVDGIQGRLVERTARGGVAEMTSTAPHSQAVNDGTKAHVIEAKDAQALRFQSGGETVFRRRVNHPGTDADPFFDRGEARATGVLEDAADGVVAKIAGR